MSQSLRDRAVNELIALLRHIAPEPDHDCWLAAERVIDTIVECARSEIKET